MEGLIVLRLVLVGVSLDIQVKSSIKSETQNNEIQKFSQMYLHRRKYKNNVNLWRKHNILYLECPEQVECVIYKSLYNI